MKDTPCSSSENMTVDSYRENDKIPPPVAKAFRGSKQQSSRSVRLEDFGRLGYVMEDLLGGSSHLVSG